MTYAAHRFDWPADTLADMRARHARGSGRRCSMTLHFLHRAVVVPKAPVLFPEGVNALAEERHECTKLAVRARTEAQRTRIIRWADRLTARIAKEPKE